MNDKELYSYIVTSLDIMNKTLMVSEQNTVKLFSYLYNNYVDLNNKFVNYEEKMNNTIDELRSNIIKQNNSINKEISTLKKYQKKYDDKISLIANKKSKSRIIFEKIKESIIKYYKYVFEKTKNIIIKCYQYIYNIVCYKKIKRQKEEELRLIEAEKIKKEKEYKEMIKNILKK